MQVSPTAGVSDAPPDSGRSRPADLRALTSLRFFAAFVVFVHHIVNAMYSANHPGLTEAQYPFHIQLLRQGHIGVTFFFVLSGFVLAHVYDRVFSRFDIKTVGCFYVARIARIYPLHILTFVCFIPAALYGGGFSKSVLAVGAVANVFLLQAWVPLGGADGVAVSYNSVSWTLSVEAFFYLMFPVALFIIARIGRRHLTQVGVVLGVWWFAILFMTSLFPVSETANWFFSNFPAMRLIDFVAGIWLYLVITRRSGSVQPASQGAGRSWTLRWTGIEVCTTALLVAGVAASAYLPIRMQYGGLVVPAVLATVAIYSLERGALSQLIRNRFSVYLGELSFGLYMIHFGVIVVANRAGLPIPSHPYLVGGALFVVAMLGSAFAYHVVEKPARSRLRKSGNSLVDRIDRRNRGKAADSGVGSPQNDQAA